MKGRFPGLDSLRFFAALGVAITHVSQLSFIFKLPSLYPYHMISYLGDTCVTFFFVLSGFLISYLLLKEWEEWRGIDLYRFYVRRILRIWPLYFSIFLLGFFVLPMIPIMNVPGYQPPWTGKFWISAFLYMVFSPHVAEVFLPGIPYAGVLWSVGVEEWFYFIWPLAILFAGRRTAILMTGLALVFVLGRLAPGRLAIFLGYLRFDCLAIGGLFAALIIYLNGSERLRQLHGLLCCREVQICVLLALPLTLILSDHITQSAIFGIFILNVATNNNSIIKIHSPLFEKLGAISYGMYGYNWIAAALAVHVGLAIPMIQNHIIISVVIFFLGLAFTILMALTSYYLIEKPFLDLKRLVPRRVSVPA